MSEISLTLDSEKATQLLAGWVAGACGTGDCILLRGELGAGKTAFARGFIHALQPDAGDIVSPTFTIVQHYPGAKPIWHFDLYRLKNEAELRETGLDEALQSGITLIEWPDLAQAFLPPSALHISIGFTAQQEARIFTLRGGEKWQPLLATAQKTFYK